MKLFLYCRAIRISKMISLLTNLLGLKMKSSWIYAERRSWPKSESLRTITIRPNHCTKLGVEQKVQQPEKKGGGGVRRKFWKELLRVPGSCFVRGCLGIFSAFWGTNSYITHNLVIFFRFNTLSSRHFYMGIPPNSAGWVGPAPGAGFQKKFMGMFTAKDRGQKVKEGRERRSQRSCCEKRFTNSVAKKILRLCFVLVWFRRSCEI